MTLTVTDDLRVTSRSTQTVIVDQPNPSFTAPQAVTAPGSDASFDPSASTDPEGVIAKYSWNFGDDSPPVDTGTSSAVTHTYADRGNYTVTLTTTNGYGQIESAQHTVTVDNTPTASFTAPQDAQIPGAAIGFDAGDSMSDGGSISGYSWDFGDGSAAAGGVTTSHEYSTTGVYDVTLTVTDDLGVSSTATQTIMVDQPNPSFTAPPTIVSPGSEASFDPSASTDPAGVITNYSWNFGDDSPPVDTGTSSAVTHTYADRGNYTVTLTTTNSHGQIESAQHTVTVDNAPIAAVTAPANVQAPGTSLGFDAGDSMSDGGSISGYSWDFGDGSAAAGGVTASHEYSTTGVYDVTLTVTDDLRVSSMATHTIIVDQPNPSFTRPQRATAPGSDVQFDASGSTDPEGRITDYSWNFGDGSPTADGATPTHAYTDRGKYTVTLTISNGYNQTDEHSAHDHGRHPADRVVHGAHQRPETRRRGHLRRQRLDQRRRLDQRL